METFQVLSYLNTKVSRHLRESELEEAKESAMQATDYYFSSFKTLMVQPYYCTNALDTQIKITGLLLHKVGVRYRSLGEEREDEELLNDGKELIRRSTLLLKFSRQQDSTITLARPTLKSLLPINSRKSNRDVTTTTTTINMTPKTFPTGILLKQTDLSSSLSSSAQQPAEVTSA